MSEKVNVAVCGLHMRGYPLNMQLMKLGAVFIETAYTAKKYKLYKLMTAPEKPGLIKVTSGGEAIEVEVFSLIYNAAGRFLEMIPSPLGLGKIELENGSSVIGFICESYALEQAEDITAYGGWRAYTLK